MWQVRGHSDDPKVLPFWIDAMLLLLADLLALSWVAMASALTAKNQNQATLRTLWRILILPWVVGGMVVLIGHGWNWLVLDTIWMPGWRLYLRLWFWLGLGADLGFGLWAWWRLRTRFRQLALQRYDPKPQPSHQWLSRSKTATADSATSTVPARELQANRQQKRTSALWKIAFVGGATLVLVALALAFTVRRAQPSFPAPLGVSLQHTNAPVRVAQGPGGAFLILPDGSLWHWGHLTAPASPLGKAPEQVGTNCDWIQAVGTASLCVGLRSDGTIWEWGRHSRGLSDTPRQVDPSRDWIGISATPRNAVALRRDGTLWAWGDSSGMQSSYGTNLSWTNLVQVGDDHDWVAVSSQRLASLGLRRDGTLWVWGLVFTFGNGPAVRNTYPAPTLVCRKTNWVGFTTGFQTLARTRSGELWEPLDSPPNAEGPAELTCRLVASNAPPDHAAVAYCGTGLLFEVRPDGTLWKKDSPMRFLAPTTSPIKWRQVGNRSDWLSIWGYGGTAFGLTSDGILWTWGIDPTRLSVLDLSAKLKLLQLRIKGYFAGTPSRIQPPRMPAYQSEPRPLMRLQ
jgi:hypothetical protein